MLEVLGDLDYACYDKRKPFTHQKQAIRFMAYPKYHGNILALDVGLGKTFTALLAAKAYQLYYDYEILVLAPPKVLKVWQREAEGVGVEIKTFSAGKIPEPPEYNYVLLADEAHLFQNIRSQRTKAFLKLASAPQCKACYPITGTPIRNGKPMNLLPLLLAIQHPLAKNLKAFQERYCNATLRPIPGQPGRKYLDVSGASNLPELHQKIKDSIMYRKKRDCLDMPSCTDIMVPVDLSEKAQVLYDVTIENLEAEHEYRIQEKLKEFLGWFPEQVQAIMEARSRHREGYKKKLLSLGRKSLILLNESISERLENFIEEQIIAISDEGFTQAFLSLSEPTKEQRTLIEALARQGAALVSLGQAIHAGSLAKCEAAIERAEEILEQGNQVVIFTLFQDSAELIAQELAERLGLSASFLACTGKASKEQVQGCIDAFQSKAPGKNYYGRVFVGTYGACGVGITLTQAQDLILVDRAWVPTDVHQVKGRIDRVGQQYPTSIYWLQYGQADERIDSLLQEKQKRIDVILEGKSQEEEPVVSPELAEEILYSLFEGIDGR